MFDSICPHCGNPVSAPDHYNGKTIKCSGCGGEFRATPQEFQEFEFSCQHCGNSITAPVTAAGHVNAPCPHCKAEITIPRVGAKLEPPTKPDVVPELKPEPPIRASTSPKWVIPVAVAICIGIVGLVGWEFSRKQKVEAAQKNLENKVGADVAELLRKANRISTATKRGLSRAELVDSVAELKYDQSKTNSSSTDRYDEVFMALHRAIQAWELASALWEISVNNLNTKTILPAISLMTDVFGREETDKLLGRPGKIDFYEVFSDRNRDQLIQICFITATGFLSDAELEMSKAKQK